MPSASPTVFVSYSHKDKDLLGSLLAQLKTLEQAGLLEVWADMRIDAGDKWYPEIEGAMQRAAVAVCLVSENFLSSVFCTKEEVPFLLKRAAYEGLLIVPVLLSDCVWEAHRWLKETQMLPGEGLSVRTHFPQNPAAVFAKVAKRIYNKLKDVNFKPTTPLPKWPPLAADRVDLSHLPKTGKELFGRGKELELLDRAWASQEVAGTVPTRVLALRAHGGVGKSTLVNHWLAEMERDNFRGATRVYGWSFYSQGAHDQTAASASTFIDAALRFFGDSDPAAGLPWDKGARLAGLVGNQRSLLVLDGMEPLQSGHTFDRGKLRDAALESLLRGLARRSRGLCLITTREPLRDLEGQPNAVTDDLEQITPDAGRALLRTAQVMGTDAELEALASRFGPHALAVSLLGVYLREQPGHGIGPAAALEKMTGERPIDRVLAGFEQWLGDTPACEALRLVGFFDRPADTACLRALRQLPRFPGLNDQVMDLGDAEWNQVLARLEQLRLLQIRQQDSGLPMVDAHPLIREHFAGQLKGGGAWREGHRRLYEHYRATTADKAQPTLEDLQPLYQAVAHGCAAELYQEAFEELYMKRIQRREPHDPRRREHYFSWDRFGAINQELATLATFFDAPWASPSGSLSDEAQSDVLALVGYGLQAVGQLGEAARPMLNALELRVKREDWRSAATSAGDLSDHYRLIGELPSSRRYALQAVDLAARSDVVKEQMLRCANCAVVYHQLGEWREADQAYADVRRMQRELAQHSERECGVLYARRGFHAADFLLDSVVELVECHRGLRSVPRIPPPHQGLSSAKAAISPSDIPELLKHESITALDWLRARDVDVLAIALSELTLGRALCMQPLLTMDSFPTPIASELEAIGAAIKHIGSAIGGLRSTGHADFLLHGLLARSWATFFIGQTSPAQADLDEAWEIAKRGLMRLHMADIHLVRARLFYRETKYPWESPSADLAAAEKLINECGYHRRDEELADAKRRFSGRSEGRG